MITSYTVYFTAPARMSTYTPMRPQLHSAQGLRPTCNFIIRNALTSRWTDRHPMPSISRNHWLKQPRQERQKFHLESCPRIRVHFSPLGPTNLQRISAQLIWIIPQD